MKRNPPDFILRDAEVGDVPLILQFIRELAVYERMPEAVAATVEGLRRELFERRKAEVVLAEVGGEAVGFALYFENFSTFEGHSGLYLEDLYIRPEWRGHGIGRAIFERLRQRAAERGCPRMEWVCLEWNAPSIAFYRRMGARMMEEWRIFRLTGPTLTGPMPSAPGGSDHER